ncbi:MAG: AAA family ATPase [Nocardioides sp.]|jgi:hypothetical protein
MRLLVLIGPPAVGKMTVGRAIAQRSDFRLFHNHHSIEMLLDVFAYGTPPFDALNVEIRRRVFEEAAASGTNLIFTYVMAMDSQGDADYLRRLMAPYLDQDADIRLVELRADLATRLERNRTEFRLAAKPSKRDLEWSEENVRGLDAERLVSHPEIEGPGERLFQEHATLRLDTTDLSAEDAADEILRWLTGD